MLAHFANQLPSLLRLRKLLPEHTAALATATQKLDIANQLILKASERQRLYFYELSRPVHHLTTTRLHDEYSESAILALNALLDLALSKRMLSKSQRALGRTVAAIRKEFGKSQLSSDQVLLAGYIVVGNEAFESQVDSPTLTDLRLEKIQREAFERALTTFMSADVTAFLADSLKLNQIPILSLGNFQLRPDTQALKFDTELAFSVRKLLTHKLYLESTADEVFNGASSSLQKAIDRNFLRALRKDFLHLLTSTAVCLKLAAAATKLFYDRPAAEKMKILEHDLLSQIMINNCLAAGRTIAMCAQSLKGYDNIFDIIDKHSSVVNDGARAVAAANALSRKKVSK